MTDAADWKAQGSRRPRAPRLLSSEELRRLSRRSGARATFAIARQWAVIALAIAFAVYVGAWWAFALALVVVSTRQHGLAVLMHDGAHHLLYRNRLINDVVSDVALAFPLFVSTQLYRRHHFVHHRYLNTANDPDLDPVAGGWTRRRWLRIFLGDLTGINMLKAVDSVGQFSMLGLIGKSRQPVRRALGPRQLIGFTGFLLAVAAVLTLLHGWLVYLILWILPSITVLNFILRFRAVAEHVGCDDTNDLNASRTVVPSIIERLLLAPCNINFHLEHHLYPSVPHYNLGRLHRLIRKQPVYEELGIVQTGYLLGRNSVFGNLTARAEATATQA